MSASATIASIKAHLSDLEMPGSLEAIDNLLAAQVALRQERRLISAMRSSNTPIVLGFVTISAAVSPSTNSRRWSVSI